MFNRLMLAATFVLSTQLAFIATSQAQTSPAPVNPLQQRRTPAAPAATAPTATAPTATTEAKPARAAKAPSAKGTGAARRTQCSKEYQAAKAANTLNGQKWSAFYSSCNTRLKAAGQ